MFKIFFILSSKKVNKDNVKYLNFHILYSETLSENPDLPISSQEITDSNPCNYEL